MRRYERLLAVTLSPLLLGCSKDESRPRKAHPQPGASVSRASAAARDRATVGAAPPAAAPLTSKESEEPSELATSAKNKKAQTKIGSHRLVIDQLVDVAPAGPSAATTIGVLLVTRDGRTHMAPLRPGQSQAPNATETPVSPIDVSPTELVALERGPVAGGGYAYFVHGGHLVRRRLNDGNLDDLASDARSYTRVALPDLPLPDVPSVVAYVARHPTDKETLVARLWVEGQGTVALTPDGSTGHSVALARTTNGYLAVSLESRTGMSPVHVRRVSFEASKVKLGNDVVAWIAGTAQPLTEVYAIGDPNSVWGLLPVERDATHFGLARITLGLWPHMGSEVHWREYPNGLEPAVVTSGYLCNRPVVLYARPANAAPHATQELHLASIGADGLGASTVIANSRAFADASFASLDGGALVVYVADRRTWARRLRCLP